MTESRAPEIRRPRRRMGPPISILAASLLMPAWGCTPSHQPPAIRAGSLCAACGMSLQDLRFACERRVDGAWRVYDSIECLVRDGAGAESWLPDYDTRTLHAVDSMWVVRGRFFSPMGGGLAAFLDRSAAEDVAARTQGRTVRLDQLQAANEGAFR